MGLSPEALLHIYVHPGKQCASLLLFMGIPVSSVRVEASLAPWPSVNVAPLAPPRAVQFSSECAIQPHGR